MIDRVLIDNLMFKHENLAKRWANAIRKAPQLIHYNKLTDELLVEVGQETFPQLAHFIEDGFDRSKLGAYFVRMGKDSVRRGFPLSETVYGLRLLQKVVLEFTESEFVLDSTVALYQALSIIPRVADFFVLGCFYLNKGFQEATIANMNTNDKISLELLTKHFKDDFFFKNDE